MVAINPRDLYGNNETAQGEPVSKGYRVLSREPTREFSLKGSDLYRGEELRAPSYTQRRLYDVVRPSMPYTRAELSPAISTVPVPLHQAARILLGK